MLLICFMPCSLCCDVKKINKNKHKKIKSSTYVKKDVYQLLIAIL